MEEKHSCRKGIIDHMASFLPSGSCHDLRALEGKNEAAPSPEPEDRTRQYSQPCVISRRETS